MNDYNSVAIPERYDIFLQDLSKDYIQLTFVGFVNTIDEARNMCKVLREVDAVEVDAGRHTYLFRCGKMQDE